MHKRRRWGGRGGPAAPFIGKNLSLVTPLKIIFTNCIRRGVFHGIWKCANVVPVHKRKDKNMKSNYLPISLLPIFGKIFE